MGLCYFLCQGRCGVVMKLSDEERKLSFLECLSSLDFILFIKTFFKQFFYYGKCHLNHSKCTVQWVLFSIFTVLYSHHHCLFLEHFRPKKKLPLVSLLLSSHLSPCQPRLYPLSPWICLSWTLHTNWNHVICGLLLLASVNLAWRFQGFSMLYYVSVLYFFMAK